jgi:Zn-dependent protease
MLNPQIIASGVVWYVAFLLSLTCHEAAHALVAKVGGDPTAFHGGQVSLNPLPHIRREPFGTVWVPILSYLFGGWMIGWGSAPYDPQWQLRHPRRAALMALAGPAANVLLVVLAAGAIHAGIAAGLLAAPSSARFTQVVYAGSSGLGAGVALFLSVLFSLNLLLALFNLLPLPPRDGNTALGLFLPKRAARRFAALSRSRSLSLFGLLISWFALDYLFHPLFLASLNLLYPGAGYR